MLLLAEGIPAIPDLTQPQSLLHLGEKLVQMGQWLALLLAGFGIVLAVLNASYWRDRPDWMSSEIMQYRHLLRALLHTVLVLTILISGFFLCATLANRYHHWEQAKIAKTAESVAGERVEQPAPLLRYTIEEPFTTITYIDGKPTEVEKRRQVDRFLSPTASQVEVTLSQATDPATTRLIYQSGFKATYQVTNTLDVSEDFVFEALPPVGYTLLQDYRVERDGKLLQPQNQGDYNFPLQLAPGESAQFLITYKAQGAPRWVYTANGRLLSQVRLTVLANFPGADFASGIVPTETKVEGQGTRFTWVFNENVSVKNPLGVFTATQRFRNTGILPRLLLLSPGILLWWLLLLYLSGPMRLQDVAIASGIFFACLLGLTYASRLMDARIAWGVLLLVLLSFAWGLGTYRRLRWGTVWVTLSGAILPVIAFLVPYTGLTLGLAGLVSIGGLVWGYFTAPQASDTGLS